MIQGNEKHNTQVCYSHHLWLHLFSTAWLVDEFIMVVLWCDSSEKFTSFCKKYYLAILCGCENKWHCDSHKCMQMMTLFREIFPSGKFHLPGVEKIDSQLWIIWFAVRFELILSVCLTVCLSVFLSVSASLQVAIAQFSDDARTEFQLSSHGNKEALLEAIQNIRYKGGNTKTGQKTLS